MKCKKWKTITSAKLTAVDLWNTCLIEYRTLAELSKVEYVLGLKLRTHLPASYRILEFEMSSSICKHDLSPALCSSRLTCIWARKGFFASWGLKEKFKYYWKMQIENTDYGKSTVNRYWKDGYLKQPLLNSVKNQTCKAIGCIAVHIMYHWSILS